MTNLTSVQQSAASIAQLAREFSPQTEQLGQLHPDVLKAMQEAGLPQMLKPNPLGTIRDFVDVCGIVAEGCMSAGWCNFVWGMHNYVIGLYPASAQQAVWADPKTLVSASLGPQGQCSTVTEAGATVSGRWRFNSGCDHAEWLLLGAMQEGGEPQLALLHKSEYEIDNTWQVIGLKGTGSKDAVCANVQVPAERLMPFSKTIMPYGALLILVIVGPVIGGAQAAVNEYGRLIGPEASEGKLLKLVESSAEVDAARALVLKAASELDENPAPDSRVTTRIFRDTAFAARLCNRATQRVFEAAGGSQLHESKPLQRIFRDVTAGCAHARLQWDDQVLPYARKLVEPSRPN
ncbi:MAG: acyl-CoA dehydrogenase family protein [Pseudomonadota bacterium]